MSVKVKVGNFTAATSTGDQAITGVGFAPKAVIFIHSGQTAAGAGTGANLGIGMASGSSAMGAVWLGADDAVGTSNSGRAHSRSHCILAYSDGTPTVDATATLVSMDSDGFTINWGDAPASAIIVGFMALGGSISAQVGTFNIAGATGIQTISGLPFSPEALFMVGTDINSASNPGTGTSALLTMGAMGVGDTNQTAYARLSRDARTSAQAEEGAASWTGDAHRFFATSGTSFNTEFGDPTPTADGFTVNVTNTPTGSSTPSIYLAMRGVNVRIASFQQRTSTGSTTTTVANSGRLAGVLLYSAGNTGGAGAIDSSSALCAQVAIGASDGTNEVSVAAMSDDALTTTKDANRLLSTTKCMSFGNVSGGAMVAEGDLTLGVGEFAIDWTTADANARYIMALTVAPASLAPPSRPRRFAPLIVR